VIRLVRALAEFGDVSDDAVREVWASDQLPAAVRAEALVAEALRHRRKLAEPFPAAAVAPLTAAWATPDLRFGAAYLLSRVAPADDAKAGLAALVDAAWADAPDDARPLLLRAAGALDVAAPLDAALDPSKPLTLRVAAARAARDEERLRRALTDPDPWVRAAAFGGLAKAAPQAVIDLAGDLVDQQPHPDPWLRARALEALAGAEGLVPHRRAVAMTAIQEPDPTVRAAGWTLLGALPDSTVVASLLAAEEPDRKAQLAVAMAVAGREEDSVEERLRTWLAGDDPTIGAVAADGLSGRSGAHVTQALTDAFERFPEPGDWERRKAIVDALADREDLDPRWLTRPLTDAEAHVRIAAFRILIERSGRSDLGTPPTQRAVEPPADEWFGVDDVERAIVTTSRGELTLLLYPRIAPSAVANFVQLAESGAYDGLLFHRVVPDFVVQGGDPENTGWGGPGWTIRDEFSPLPYARGTLGMARSDKDTAGSQWFVTLSAHPHLDGHYTAFGQLLLGWDALAALRQDDVIESVRIVRKPRSE
jgi:cyclophilin family peptidyl-prolyl cis-trans isomerase